MDALIGSSGFVGSSLLRQRDFGRTFRSSNISQCREGHFDLVICAAAPAQKWIANREPEADARNIDGLIEHLRALHCDRFVLISTVDVFASPVRVTEVTPVETQGLHAYGLNRRRLELAVEEIFPRHLVIRLPGLVGPGLRKNVIFDLLNHNNLAAVDSRAVFQFYPMVNLWADIEVALKAEMPLLHMTSEPISVAEVAREGFGRHIEQPGTGEPVRYDMISLHTPLFGAQGSYQYSKRESLLAIRAYAQSEPRMKST